MDIHENMLNTVFAYRPQTNEEKEKVIVDYDYLLYNNLYKSFQFYEAKFPAGYENIPGFEQVIETIVENSQDKNPLDELLAKQN